MACTSPPASGLFAGDVESRDATDPTDAGIVDATTPCHDDLYGAGTFERPAGALGLGSYALVLCGREDVFRLDVAPGGRIRVALRGAVPLRLRVSERPGTSRLEFEAPSEAGGEGTLDVLTGGERLVIGTLEPMAGPVAYALTLSDSGSPCASPEAESLDGGCLQGTRRMSVPEWPAGHTIAGCFSLPDTGQMLLAAGCGDTAAFAAARVVPGPGICRSLGPFAASRGDCYFELTAATSLPRPWRRAPGDGLVVAAPGGAQRWQGRLMVRPVGPLEPPVDGKWLGEIRALTASGAVTAAAKVEAAAPAFDVSGFRPSPEVAELVVAATARVAGVDIVVSPGGAGAEPWTIAVASAGAGDVPLDAPVVLDATSAPTAAALYAVSVLGTHWPSTQAALAGLPVGPPPAPAPRIHLRWSPDRAAPCGTCFLPGELPIIELSGRPGDPDIWDDAVLLHELGHWVAAGFGRDESPGGAHDGTRTSPVMAWSEGFADFFAAWRLETPVLVDRRLDGPRVRDLEAASEADPLARGTSDGRLDGLVSERLVGALLWDLIDDASDGDDAVRLPVSAVLAAALPLARSWGADRGAPGFDLVDFLDVLACVSAADGETAAELSRARGLPYDGPPTEAACASLSSGG